MKKNVCFKRWLVVALVSSNIEELNLEKLERPDEVAGVATPENLNEMTVGQMLALSDLKDAGDMFYKVCEVLLGLDRKRTAKASAVQVVRFVGWVLGRVKEINRLFEKTKGNPSPEEIRAGIKNLNFGVFGMIDWYAKRMGITDHEEVMKVPWLRLYKCLDMDNQMNEYQKRLIKIQSDEYRRKNPGNR